MKDEKPRQIAVRVLKQHAGGSGFVENLLDKELANANVSTPDRALLQELTFGVVRWQATLDWLIARKTQGRTQKALLQILLRLGLYQIFWLQRIPDHAAVHETVELARQNGFGPQAGFVNAVLRAYLRERDSVVEQFEELKRTQPALGFSHPEWLVARWQQRWGDEQLRRLLHWNNSPPPTYARLNFLRGTPEDIERKWQEEGVEAVSRKWDWLPDSLVYELKSFPSLNTLASFQHGLFYIQDPSTLLAPAALNVEPEQHVLDLCAAPGGKTTYIAQLMQNRGRIVAQDTHEARRDLVRQNCERLGVTCVEVTDALPFGVPPSGGQDTGKADAATEPRKGGTPNQGFAEEAYDRILIDAPCSNTGVMRRRVDLRWRIQPEEIERLRLTQLELLRSAAALLKPQGILVYSTCSLEPEENEKLVREFVSDNPGLHIDFERTLLPFVEGVDGAYVARLVRG